MPVPQRSTVREPNPLPPGEYSGRRQESKREIRAPAAPPRVLGGVTSFAVVATGLTTYPLPAIIGVDLDVPLFGSTTGVPISRAQVLAILLVLGITGVNHLGAKVSGRMQALVTLLLPLILLSGGAIYALVSSALPAPNGLPTLPLETRAAVPGESLGPDALVAAYFPTYFAYSGWNGVIYLACEVRTPERNVPRSLILVAPSW